MTNSNHACNHNLKRLESGYREVEQRLHDYNEVENMLSVDEVKEQASRCLSCGTPFCHGYACPLGNIIPEINEFIAMGHWKEALTLLLSTHPFPEFTARICPALCEGSCVLSINDKAVTIRQAEKLIIEMGFNKGWVKPRTPLKRRAERIAVIGSGPAGLSVAELLNRKGFSVTVFEKDLNPGGLLMYGIPNFKLEKSIVQRRIQLMQEEGIIFECGIAAGVDVSFNYLKRHFEAIVLSGGSEKPRDIEVEGRNLKEIHFAMDLLKSQNKRLIGEPLNAAEDIDARGKRVVVIGGGDTGSDCIGVALRQGAKKVTQVEILPRLPHERKADNPWPLWPNVDRSSSSHRENENRNGIRLWCIDTKRFTGNSAGKVRQLHCCEICWVNRDGRMVPVQKEDSDFTLDADLVLLALGYVGPGPNPLIDTLNLSRDEKGYILLNDQHMTSFPGVFSCGDIARGQSLVVRAMADGIAAAEHIASYLFGAKHL